MEEIASEKGGIIKKGIPCVTGVKSLKAVRVLSDICVQNKSRFIRVHSNEIFIRQSSLDGLVADFSTAGKTMKNIRVSLAGKHQAMNALLALQAVAIAAQRGSFIIDEEAVREGLAHIQQYSGLQARLSIVWKKPLVLADVAHNPEAVRVLCASLKQLHLGMIHIVFGLMQDKNSQAILSALRQITKSIIVVEAQTDRSRSAAELAQEVRQAGMFAKGFHTVADGVSWALRRRDGLPVLITGSHFVVGEAIAFLRQEKYLTINQ